MEVEVDSEVVHRGDETVLELRAVLTNPGSKDLLIPKPSLRTGGFRFYYPNAEEITTPGNVSVSFENGEAGYIRLKGGDALTYTESLVVSPLDDGGFQLSDGLLKIYRIHQDEFVARYTYSTRFLNTDSTGFSWSDGPWKGEVVSPDIHLHVDMFR